MNINTTQSLRDSVANAIHTIEDMLHHEVDTLKKGVESDAKAEVADVVADVSPVIFSLEAKGIQGGTDLTIRLHHAQGQVRRIVLNGTMTLEQLISRLRSLVA